MLQRRAPKLGGIGARFYDRDFDSEWFDLCAQLGRMPQSFWVGDCVFCDPPIRSRDDAIRPDTTLLGWTGVARPPFRCTASSITERSRSRR